MSKQIFWCGVANTDVFGMAGIYEGIGIHDRERRIRAVKKARKINVQKCGCSVEMAKSIHQVMHKRGNKMNTKSGRSSYVI